MLDGWKTVLGSVLTAIFAALIQVDTDPTRLMIWKVCAAAAAGLLGVGIAGKADKMTAAMNKPVEVIAATPAARAELATAEAAKPPAPPTLTDAQKIAAYDALHPKIGV